MQQCLKSTNQVIGCRNSVTCVCIKLAINVCGLADVRTMTSSDQHFKRLRLPKKTPMLRLILRVNDHSLPCDRNVIKRYNHDVYQYIRCNLEVVGYQQKICLIDKSMHALTDVIPFVRDSLMIYIWHSPKCKFSRLGSFPIQDLNEHRMEYFKFATIENINSCIV